MVVSTTEKIEPCSKAAIFPNEARILRSSSIPFQLKGNHPYRKLYNRVACDKNLFFNQSGFSPRKNIQQERVRDHCTLKLKRSFKLEIEICLENKKYKTQNA